MSHFFWQPVHIHSIESTADWIHFAFCNLVFIFLFLCCFCLLRDYECMLPISRWNAVHYNIALCESQNCSRSETIPLLQIKFLSSSILIFIWDLMWVKYHPVLFLLIMAGSYFRVRFLLGSSSHRLNRAWRWLEKEPTLKVDGFSACRQLGWSFLHTFWRLFCVSSGKHCQEGDLLEPRQQKISFI